jgi:hypothetical protein
LLSELFSGLPMPKIVDVLGGIGTILAKLGRSVIALSPYIEGLPTNDERVVLQLKEGNDFLNDKR